MKLFLKFFFRMKSLISFNNLSFTIQTFYRLKQSFFPCNHIVLPARDASNKKTLIKMSKFKFMYLIHYLPYSVCVCVLHFFIRTYHQ